MNFRLLITCLLLLPPALAHGETDPGEGQEEPNWVDDSHTVMIDQTQAATRWLDDFFGDADYDVERAESFLRLQFIEDWDQEDGNELKVRVRGKVELPKISRRLSLVFADDDDDNATTEEQSEQDRFGLQLEVKEGSRSRIDATLGWSGGHLRPGVRYRNEGPIATDTSYRYIQRLEFDHKDKVYTTGLVDLNHSLNSTNVLRWSNRAVWGEESEGVEWRSRISLRQIWNQGTKKPTAFNYYAAVSGVTRPEERVKNYRLGALWRRRVYRDFLYLSFEPAWNYRKRELEDERTSVWSLTMKLEIALHKERDKGD